MRVISHLAVVLLSLVLMGATRAEGWEDRLAGGLSDPQLPALSIAAFNVRMGGQFSIVASEPGACRPPRVVGGDLPVLQFVLVPREPVNCTWSDGFAEMTVTVPAEDAFRSADRIAATYTAAAGMPCYTARNASSLLQLWVARDRVLTVAAVEGGVTLAVLDQSLLTHGSDRERGFVAGFDKGLVGDCLTQLRSGARSDAGGVARPFGVP